MKGEILVACEFSGIVRDAFITRGNRAISCDLLPSEKPGPHHQCDVRELLHWEWDMIIAFPPCRYLSNVGNNWFNVEKYGVEKVCERYLNRGRAVEFFMNFVFCPCPKICVENPQGYISTAFRPPHQYFCHSDHGADYTKRTGLWLKNLPPLMATKKNHVPAERGKNGRLISKIFDGSFHLPPEERRKVRSRMHPGVAAAMAEQWGPLL